MQAISEFVAPPHAQLPVGVKHHPMFRVDLGCCLSAGSHGYNYANGWFINEAEPFPNTNLNFFTRYLVNGYDDYVPVYQNDARMTMMIERSAAAWYPTVEHMGLEL